MADGEVRLALSDGDKLTIPSHDVDRVYENLWRLAPRPGALTLAAILVSESRSVSQRTIDLTEVQSAIIREAIAMPTA